MTQTDKILRRAGGRERGAVLLRRATMQDKGEFVALARASRRFHKPWVSPATTAAAFAAYIERAEKADFEARLVCDARSGAIVGVMNLSQIFLGNFRSAYLGYWVGEPFARQGYMSCAMPALLKEAFGVIGLHRVEANIQPENGASIALVRKCGFQLEGFSRRYLKIRNRWRDHERWAMLREDFVRGSLR